MILKNQFVGLTGELQGCKQYNIADPVNYLVVWWLSDSCLLSGSEPLGSIPAGNKANVKAKAPSFFL